jgi:hypothetical protein
MTANKKETIDEIHRRIGRNLVRYQGIEECLRFILPYVHPDASAKGAYAMRNYQQRNVASKSLSPLIQQFRTAVAEMPESWDDTLQQLQKARNELVHAIHRNPQFDLLSPSGASDLLAYLDEEYQRAEEWSRIFRVQSLVLLLILMESQPSVAAEFGAHREQLIAQLPKSVEVVDVANPSQTAWASTRIVTLLRVAEVHTETVDGMTLLSRAGRFIVEREPAMNLKSTYGLKTLKEILLISGLFDVMVDGNIVRYRSKRELRDSPLNDNLTGLDWTVIRNA